jgi:CheY-like chemotaxis protein
MAAAIYTTSADYRKRRATQAPQAPTILVVDDECSVLNMVSDVLEDENLRVLTADSGQTALAVAAREHPNLIITDLMMPGMNGCALRDRLRANPSLAHIPVLLMTAAYQLQALEGFSGVIPKPFDIDDLVTHVHNHLATG